MNIINKISFNHIRGIISNMIKERKHVPLGRWNIGNSNSQVDLKILYSNDLNSSNQD